MNNFEFLSVKSISVSRGGAKNLHQYIEKLGGKRPFIITDAGLIATGILNDSIQQIESLKMEHRIFSDVTADPRESIIYAAVQQARDFDADCIVGFGGGSSMDAAKLVALLAVRGGTLDEIYGVNQAKGPRLALILIPTTAGTGSEVTQISIVTTESNEKKGVVSPLLLPDYAILDAQLTVGLPKHITAATGVDAMVHAIEAYTSRLRKNPISDSLARQALALLSKSIRVACDDGANIEARESMLLGANLAGIAFANAPVAAVHALAYPLGAVFHVPHGLANSLVLPSVAQYNLSHATKHYAEICEIIIPDAQGGDGQKAQQLIQYLKALPQSLGLPTRLSELGIKRADIPQLTSDAMKQTRLLVNNPREMTEQAAAEIYESVL